MAIIYNHYYILEYQWLENQKPPLKQLFQYDNSPHYDYVNTYGDGVHNYNILFL